MQEFGLLPCRRYYYHLCGIILPLDRKYPAVFLNNLDIQVQDVLAVFNEPGRSDTYNGPEEGIELWTWT